MASIILSQHLLSKLTRPTLGILFMATLTRVRPYGGTPDKILHLVTDPHRAGAIAIDVPAAPSLGDLFLAPHRLTRASGFVRELRATIQGKLQITGSRSSGHRGVHDPIGQTGREVETGIGNPMTTIVKGGVIALADIAPHRPVELLIPIGRRPIRRRLHHHDDTATSACPQDLAIMNALPHMMPSDSLVQMRKIGSPNDSILKPGTMSRLPKQKYDNLLGGRSNKSGKDQHRALAIVTELRRPHRG